MTEAELWRRLLVNNLVEAATRLALLARLNGGFVHPVFKGLSGERAGLAGTILGNFSDPELEDKLAVEKDNGTCDEVVAEEAIMASAQGEAAAAEHAIEKERALLEFVEDLNETELPDQLREELTASLIDGLSRLETALERTRNSGELMRFSTKSLDAGPLPDVQRVFEIWFGTNRMPLEENGVLTGFSGQTSPTTTLGRCGVTIPRSHRIGEIEPSWWRRVVMGHRPLSIESIARLNAGNFWNELRQRLTNDGVKADDAIVFLHGYNVSFEEAALRAAQIGADLNLPGATAFFSWPSLGRAHAYPADEASIEASEQQITNFLEQFAANSGARRVHLIAHSMGNRGLLRAMDRIAIKAAARASVPFGQVILAAPDVDRRTFAMLAKAYPLLASRTTLYVSSKDLAVRSSRFVHAAARVGFEPPITIEPGIDTVSVSNVDLSFLGHGYVAGCRAVLTDIHQLIVSELTPDQRAGMIRMTTVDGEYWQLAA